MEIRQYLQTAYIGKNCIYLKETDSTNIQAGKLAQSGAPEGTVVIAGKQTAGRGRKGRSWVSDSADHIYMSVLLRPKIEPANASMLTLVMGLAAAKACQEALDTERVQIKWPNDLVIWGRKLCGILTEFGMSAQGVPYLVVGVGINVNGRQFPQELKSHAISLCEAAGHEVCREQLIARILYFFEQDYEMFLQTQDLSRLQTEYESFLVNKELEVQVLDPQESYTGICRGINPRGELLVDCDGGIKKVYAGEVSVRGVYGYV